MILKTIFIFIYSLLFPLPARIIKHIIYLKSPGKPSSIYILDPLHIHSGSSIKFSQVARQNQQTGRKRGIKKNINQVDF